MNRTAYFVVDRVEGSIAVLIEDGGMQHQAPVVALPRGLREGAVLRVPLTGANRPVWAGAAIDAEEESRRRAAQQQRLDRMRGRDPGGDVKL